jgi:hypothetical protein
MRESIPTQLCDSLTNLINNVTLRQSAQTALNRDEACHRFCRAITYVNSGKLRVRTEAEQQMWNECSKGMR